MCAVEFRRLTARPPLHRLDRFLILCFPEKNQLISAENRADIEQAFARLPRGARATAVRYALEELATLAPGNSVEVRFHPTGLPSVLPDLAIPAAPRRA